MDTKPQGLDGEFARRVIKLMAAVNVRVYKLTRGRIGGTWRVGAGWRNPVPICLLEHRGRRTGRLRTTPLVYLEDADRVVVVASQAGRSQHPLWYRNIEADPAVTVQIRGRRLAMRARTADAEERAELWPRLVALYSDYDSYQSWTDREIPVVLLEPR
jgi:F420H(2)-dependent quinone reductase